MTVIRNQDATANLLAKKSKFCAMVVSNANPKRTGKRLAFFESLSKRRPVDSGGRAINNVGGPVADKIAFLENYRFNLAFENYSAPGYTTEKLFHAFEAGCVPLYLGNPDVAEDFNPQAIVNLADFASMDEMADFVIELDKDPERYQRYLDQPPFHDNQINKYYSTDYLKPFFEKILKDPPKAGRKFFYFADIAYNASKSLKFEFSACQFRSYKI